MLDVCLLGTGGMMPLPYRWLTSLMVRYNGMSVLIDCGEGTQIAMKKKGWSPNPIGVMCFTHYHADHISGLPGMLLAMANSDRTEPLLMTGPKGLEHVVNSLRVIAPELPFQIIYRELTEQEEDITFPDDSDFRNFHLRAFRVNHNITCYGYSIYLDRDGQFDVVRAEALGIPKPYWNRLQKGETVKLKQDDDVTFTPDMVMGPPRKGLKVTYTTDTRPCVSIARNAAGSDLFICEGMYGEPEKLPKAKEHKHMMFTEAAQLAKDAGVKEMWLTHYSPSLMRPEEFMGPVRDIFPNSIAAKDGRSVDLRFED